MTPALFRHHALINGAWVDADDGSTFTVTDPATGEALGAVADCGAVETHRAIAAATAAAPGWAGATSSTRAEALMRLNNLLLEELEPLAELLVRENGKPLAEARGELRYGASFIRWFAAEAARVYGETIPASTADKRILVTRQPVGLCAMITPWNFPSAMLARKLGAALAAGCTTVVKPAEETPFSALAFGALCQRAGIPDGVVNIIPTANPVPVGQALCGAATVRKLSFTGSTEVGRLLAAQCAPTLKRLSLELGGNAPFIVFADADLDAAADGAIASKFRNCGQTCVASNRFLVHRSVISAFTEKLVQRVSALTTGNGLTAGVQVGPMISRPAKDKVTRLLTDARGKGATIVHGTGEGPGLFIDPVVLTGVTDEMALWTEEIFGPVVALRTFDTEAEAIALANDTDYGLAAYFYTRDLARSWRVRESLEYGMVGVNTGMMSTAQAPFGGVKQSGLGREGSRHGIDEYLDLKYTCVALG